MSFTQRKLNRLKKWDQYALVLKKYSKQPVIKNVDIEELKKQFAPVAAAPAPKASKKTTEAPATVETVEIPAAE